jgi:hypothetical protein
MRYFLIIFFLEIRKRVICDCNISFAVYKKIVDSK